MSFFDRHITDELCGFAILNLRGPNNAASGSYKLVEYIYPAVSAEMQAVVMAQACSAPSERSYGQYEGQWYYCCPSAGGVALIVFSKIFCPPKFLDLAAALGVVYGATSSPPQVLEAYLQAYLKNRVPALPAINLKGWKASDYNIASPLQPAASAASASPLKALLAAISVEAVIVWSALLLKKRVAVVGSDRKAVSDAVSSLALLASHRAEIKNDRTGMGTMTAGDSIASVKLPCPLYPHVLLRAPTGTTTHPRTQADVERGVVLQLEELVGRAGLISEDGGSMSKDFKRPKTHYLAGFTDPLVAANSVSSLLPASDATSAAAAGGSAAGVGAVAIDASTTLWDVCVDLDAGAVAIADDASADLALCSIHKDLAKSLMSLLELEGSSNDSSNGGDGSAEDDEAVVSLVRSKTVTLLEALRSLFPLQEGGDAAPAGFTAADWALLPSRIADLFTSSEEEAAAAAAFGEKLKASGTFGSSPKPELLRFCWGVSKAEGLHHPQSTA